MHEKKNKSSENLIFPSVPFMLEDYIIAWIKELYKAKMLFLSVRISASLSGSYFSARYIFFEKLEFKSNAACDGLLLP